MQVGGSPEIHDHPASPTDELQFSESPSLKKRGGKGLRKTLGVSLQPPHTSMQPHAYALSNSFISKRLLWACSQDP